MAGNIDAYIFPPSSKLLTTINVNEKKKYIQLKGCTSTYTHMKKRVVILTVLILKAHYSMCYLLSFHFQFTEAEYG